jgi:NAD(P)-dependent dehydrogenase (short-subunit alcohol dehydrogenase family)
MAEDEDGAPEPAPERRALVTGGGSGIGRGVALALAGAGLAVTVAGRTPGTLAETVELVTGRGGQAVAVECDVTDPGAIDQLVAAAAGPEGRLDVLVNSAQSLSYGSLRRSSDEELDAAWRSGPLAAFRLMRAALPALRSAGGLVVNVASGAGISAPPAMAVYAMVKEAMRTLSRVAAVEWGPLGVRVVALCPLAATGGLSGFEEQLNLDAERDILPQVPLRRLGDPEADVGATVVFLASPGGSYVTGTTIMVDGGYTYLR